MIVLADDAMGGRIDPVIFDVPDPVLFFSDFDLSVSLNGVNGGRLTRVFVNTKINTEGIQCLLKIVVCRHSQ